MNFKISFSGTIGCLLVCKKHGIPSDKEKQNVLFFAVTKEKEIIRNNETVDLVSLHHMPPPCTGEIFF